MIKCNRDQVKRLQKKLQRETDPVVRQRIQMILLREDGKTQPKIAELMGVSLIPLPGPLESKTIMRFPARRRAWRPDIECDSIGHLIREGDRMIKCNRDQVKRLQKKLQRETDPVVRQRIQMILLREDGKTQPKIAELMGVSLSTVNRAHMAYDNGGVNALRSKPTGGRRNENMTFEEEKAF